MAERVTFDQRGNVIADETRAAFLKALMETFGYVWANDPADRPFGADPATISADRQAAVLPVAAGCHLALLQFMWLTAPPGGTVEQLLDGHNASTAELHRTDDVTLGLPAGHFWLQGDDGHGR